MQPLQPRDLRDQLKRAFRGAEIGKDDQEAFALRLEPGQGMVFELRAPKKLEIEEFEPEMVQSEILAATPFHMEVIRRDIPVQSE